MWIKNVEIANILSEIADILEINGENIFKVRAYRKAVLALENLPEDIQAAHQRGELDSIPGIGKSIAQKIREFLETGSLKYLEDLRASIPLTLLEILQIPGLGPKTVKKLYQELDITTVEELEAAARSGCIAQLKGMGKKTEASILRGIGFWQESKGRLHIGIALPIAREIEKALRSLDEVDQVSIAGSIRRMKETIGDVDILVTSSQPDKVMDAFTSLPQVKEVLVKGPTKSSVIVRQGMQVDLRVVPASNFGASLHYFTGSKEHNIKLRGLANRRGLKSNEYGVFRLDNGEKIGGETEESVFQAIGLPYIPPELREDRGEIEAALENRLPHLIEFADVKGDLHVHSEWSDGADRIEDIAHTAQSLGYEYIAITDHSKSLKMAGGLTEEDVLRQIEEIHKLNTHSSDFRILSGIEVDILPDGTLDLDDAVLQELDIVIASVHSAFNQDEEKMTRRIIRAMENEHVDIIGHPTGRLLGRLGKMKAQRESYQVNLLRLVEFAAATSTCLEICAFPERLDLSDVNAIIAKDHGVTLSLGSDAHNRGHLHVMQFGVAIARRAWLEPSHILNTLPLQDLLKRLKCFSC